METRKLDDAPDMLRAKDAAKLLGLSVDTVSHMCAKGELPGAKLGKFWVIPKSKLVERIESLVGA